MNILAFDTCNAIASAAIMIKDELIHSEIIEEHSKQAEKTLSLTDICLRKANLILPEIDVIAVTIGPGSFTGVRIGLSIAKAFELVIKKNTIAITCFEALAYHYINHNLPIMVAMDAKRDQIYIQNFDFEKQNQILKPITEPILIDIAVINQYIPESDFIMVGDGSRLINNRNHKSYPVQINAEMVANAAKIKLLTNLKKNKLEPLYVKTLNY